MAISMLKIRRPLGRLIFNMGIAIPGKTVFLIETAPWRPWNLVWWMYSLWKYHVYALYRLYEANVLRKMMFLFWNTFISVSKWRDIKVVITLQNITHPWLLIKRNNNPIQVIHHMFLCKIRIRFAQQLYKIYMYIRLETVMAETIISLIPFY